MNADARFLPLLYAGAVCFVSKTADQGAAYAQYNLGAMYTNGWGVPQDYVEAHKWLNLAAAGFPAWEPERREMAVRNRDQLAAKMTAAQIAEAQRLAREWKPNTRTP
jgi:TPR repeat protein